MTPVSVIDELRQLVRAEIDRVGLRPAATHLGVPLGQLRSLIKGRAVRGTTLLEIAAALDREICLRPRQLPATDLQRRRPAAPPPEIALESVRDRPLAEMLAVLADEYEEMSDAGRRSLVVRFWAAHPDLRERTRTLARVVAWLGWRVVEGGGSTTERLVD